MSKATRTGPRGARRVRRTRIKADRSFEELVSIEKPNRAERRAREAMARKKK